MQRIISYQIENCEYHAVCNDNFEAYFPCSKFHTQCVKTLMLDLLSLHKHANGINYLIRCEKKMTSKN